jgi:hypothetical protein
MTDALPARQRAARAAAANQRPNTPRGTRPEKIPVSEVGLLAPKKADFPEYRKRSFFIKNGLFWPKNSQFLSKTGQKLAFSHNSKIQVFGHN